MKIIFIKGNSMYGALRVYSDKLIEEFKRRGHDIDIIDRTNPGEWENAINIVDETYDMVWGYVMLPFKLKILLKKNGKNVDNIKFVAFCGDHPIYIDYWLREIKPFNKNVYLLVGDVNQLNCIRKYYPWINVNSFDGTIGDGGKDIVRYEDRKFDVFFGGTYYDVKEELNIINEMEVKDRKVANEIIKRILHSEGMPLECAMEKVLEKENINLSLDEFGSYMLKFIPVDRYIRGFYRNKFIHAALMTKADVHVYGNNWEKSDFIQLNNFHIIEGAKNMKKGNEYMANSKIVLNIMPWSRMGMHERILNALMAGAICVTNTNAIIQKKFGTTNGVIGFGVNDDEKLIGSSIKKILLEVDRSSKYAENGKRMVSDKYDISKYYDMVWKSFEELNKN